MQRSENDREKQLSFAQQLARIGGWEWRPEENVVISSPELMNVFGTRAGTCTIEEWLLAVHPEDVGRVRAAMTEVLAGEPMDVRFRIRCADGTIVYTHARAERVGGDGTEPLRVIGVSQDVTEQMSVENALRESEARYRVLVEQAKDAIVSVDLDGRVVALNRAAEELTGKSRIEWIGRSVFEALTPDSAAIAQRRLAAAIAGSDPVDYMEYDIRSRGGRTSRVEAQVRAVRANDKIVGAVLVARDITARREAEAKTEQEKRLASLGQLATSVAHEFNNVLMSILPFAETLQRRLPGDEHVAAATRRIREGVRRGRQISQEILRFARPVNPDLTPLVISEWAEAFRKKAEAMLGPSFTVTIAVHAAEAAAAADRALLDQVATNIALNARDAMPDGGSFEIAVRADDENVFVDFTDSGPGIPPELLDRIFEPLYTTKWGGHGLGLSVAHQAMLQQGGSIDARSAPGEGSTFTIALPLVAAPQPAAVPQIQPGRRILIVEDDEPVGEGLRLLLSDEGFDVKLVTRGNDAVPAVTAFQPDLVLLDVNLPDISGIEVFDRIRSHDDDLPVIFSTGHADARALAEVREPKVRAIMKPYELAELLALMSSVIA